MSDDKLQVERLEDGAVWRLALGGSKGNVLDADLTRALDAALVEAAQTPGLKAILIEGQGRHFSFGASVQEHMPGEVAGMLRRFHALLLRMTDGPVALLAVVRGQCLGGGLELALAGSQIFVAEDARLGQPEIQLAVFAPAASCLLPSRVGQGVAEDLLLSGRSVGADEAVRIGLAAGASPDPQAAALDYFDKYIAARSAAALEVAVTAARGSYLPEVKRRLAEVERLYVERTIKTRDAIEGLNAFIAKRAPKWEHR